MTQSELDGILQRLAALDEDAIKTNRRLAALEAEAIRTNRRLAAIFDWLDDAVPKIQKIGYKAGSLELRLTALADYLGLEIKEEEPTLN